MIIIVINYYNNNIITVFWTLILSQMLPRLTWAFIL